MIKLLNPGRIIFAIGMIALSILSLLSSSGFIIGRPPAALLFSPAIADIAAILVIIASIAIIIQKKAGLAALVIAALIFLLSVLVHLPKFMNDWANAWKSIALMGGALIVAGSFLTQNAGKILIIAGSVCVAAFFIVGGYAHFQYAGFVQHLIPDYIPFHLFWTYFCGICLLAGGAGLLIPQTRKWAALLSGIMVAGWFVLLHIPRFIANTKDASDRMGLCESFTFVGILFVLAAMFSKKK